MLHTAFRPSCMHRASVFRWHKRFKEGRLSVRGDEMCGRSKEINTPEWIGQRFRVRVRVTMLRFKRVQEEIQSEKANSLQIGSVEFSPGQYTSLQLYPWHRLFDQDGHQDSSSPSRYTDHAPCDIWSLPTFRGCCFETIEEMKEAVTKVIDRLTQ